MNTDNGFRRLILVFLLCINIFPAAALLRAQQTEDISFVQEAEIKAWDAAGTGYIILDVRPADEVKDFGHVPDSLNIPMWVQQEGGPPTIDSSFDEKVKAQVAANATVVILADSEWIARRSAPHLKELGYENVHVFKNGIIGTRPSRTSLEFLPGWMASDLPWVEGAKSYGRYSTDEKVTEVDAETVRKWIRSEEKFIIIDVRTERELKQYGRPENSVNIPLNIMVEKDGKNLMQRDPDFAAKVREQTKNYDKIMTICTLSWRAGMAADVLQQAGMDNVYVFHHGIQGRVNGHGITKGWRAHGLPYVEAEPQKE